jgi:hypothetical protein
MQTLKGVAYLVGGLAALVLLGKFIILAVIAVVMVRFLIMLPFMLVELAGTIGHGLGYRG